MSGGDPRLGIHQNSGIKTDIVRVFLDKFLEPCFFYVVLKLGAEGTVVPGIGKSAVDLAAGIYETAVFAESDDLVHCFFSIVH